LGQEEKREGEAVDKVDMQVIAAKQMCSSLQAMVSGMNASEGHATQIAAPSSASYIK
jgi:hypothetical protein